MGARGHHGGRSGGGGGSGGGSPAVPPATDENAAWAKLVARAQNLEEALASERASKRLLAARTSTEKAELLAKLAKAQEDREGMEHLWRDTKLQLQRRAGEWEAERSSLYQELGKLRAQLRRAGLEPLPPSAPPTNLAVALRDEPDAASAAATADAPRATATGETAEVAHAAGAEEAPTGGRPSGGDSRTPSTASQAGAQASALAAVAAASSLLGERAGPSESLERQASKLDGTLSSTQLAANVLARASSKQPPPSRSASAGRRPSAAPIRS